MAYKMLVSDLDETLLNDDGTVNEKNVNAIKAASAQGFKFVPNTGRSYLSVQPLLKELGLHNKADQFVISYNGAAIIENENNQVFLSRAMDFKLANQIFKAGLVDETVDAHIYTIDQLYIYNLSASDEKYMAERAVPFEVIDTAELDFLTNKPIMKVIFESPNSATREKIKLAVIEAVGETAVEATFSSQRYVEFNQAGVDKGSAALLLGEKLGIKAEEIIAVGDNNNDIAMIRAAGLGISVANGIATVQEAADIVTKRTNNEGAIAEIIERYVLEGN